MNNQPEEKSQPYVNPQNYQPPVYRQQGQQQPSPYPYSQQVQHNNPFYGNYTQQPYQIQPSALSQQHSHKTPQQQNVSLGGCLIAIGISITIIMLTIRLMNNSISSTQLNSITPTPSQVGNTIIVNGVSCEVISVQGSSNSSEPGWSLVDIKIVNNSSGEIHYYASDFHIINDTGNIIDADSQASSLQIVSGSLAPGGSIEGNVAFGLIDIQNTKMIWQPDDTNNLSYSWKLKY